MNPNADQVQLPHRSTSTAEIYGAPTLVVAGYVFAAVVAFHNSDHARRGGDSVSTDVLAIAIASIVLSVVVIALVVGRHRLGPVVATAAGFALAAGYFLVHFTAERTWLSDSLIDGNVDTVTIVAGVLETASALLLGAAGALATRRAGGLTSAAVSDWAAEWRTARVTLLHPVVIAFTIINAIGLAVTFATL